MSPPDPNAPGDPGAEFKQDYTVDKPGIVGARWWHQGLVDEDRRMSRRQALVAIGAAGGVVAAVSALGVGVAVLSKGTKESVSIALRESLGMQKAYGWDFGARGVPLVFNGVAEGPFVRAELAKLAAVMSPAPGANAKYHVSTLVESLLAQPTATLPDPMDGRPRPDGAAFRRLADVIVPIATPEMRQAYAAGEALARLARGRTDLAVLADMPGHQAVAFAAGAASTFEPVLLLDNWPHPHGVVPSHRTLAALAYYQPRFASQKPRGSAPPLFVLDRLRLAAYSEESDRFDNRYYARMPSLESLAKDGVRTLRYVVASPAALPEPDDLSPILASAPAAGAPGPALEVRALAVTDFRSDALRGDPDALYYRGSSRNEAAFWGAEPSGPAADPSATEDYRFERRRLADAAVGKVPVVVAASGLVLAAALDRRGSMNRFAGGWSG